MTDVVGVPIVETKVVLVPTGQKGGPGASAYDIAYANDPSVGTEAEWLASLQGQSADMAEVQDAIEAYAAPIAHTHAQSDVTGLTAALAGKASSSHTHAQSDVTGLETALAGKADSSHSHAQSDVTGLAAALAGKSDTGHTHTSADISDFDDAVQAIVDANPGGGGAVWGGITGTLTDQTDLAAALNGKASSSHTHTAADVTDFDAEVSANTDVAANTAARHTHSNAAVLNATTASFTTADETKLDGIATGATANDTDANLKNRANHTGTQTASTISDFNTAAFPAGSANNPHTTQGAARNSSLPKNHWQYTGTDGVDNPTNAAVGDEWISA